MRFGKLTADELEECVLQRINHKLRKEVILSAAHGEDCAALKVEDILLLSCDPITAKMPLSELGRLSVDVACNDIVSNGGEPIALMFTVIVPPSSSTDDIKEIMHSAAIRAKEIDVDIIGGHTEFSDSVTRAIVSVTAAGTTKKIFKKTDLKVGDLIFMTKYAAIEGTVILAQSLKQHLKKEDDEVLREFQSSLSVQTEGKILRDDALVTTMHDITEGGVLGAVAELAYGVNLGAVVYESQVPVHDLTKRLCKITKTDPCRLISSGSLLFTLSQNSSKIIQSLNEKGINAVQIGKIVDTNTVEFIKTNGTKENVVAECDHLFLAKI